MLIYRVFFFNLVIFIVRRFRGRGSVEGFMEGRQCRDIFRGGPVKKNTLYI